MKNFGRCVLAAMALLTLTCSSIAWAQPSPCSNLQVRISNGVQVIDAPVNANCAFSQGGLAGVYTVYSHLTGQPLTPNSPNYSLTANVQRLIFGCVVPSTKQEKMWEVLPNETKCSAPVSKPLTLTVRKTASQNPLVKGKAGQSYAIIFNVSNGPTTAPTLITDTLPTGITTSGPVSASAGTLSGCPASGATNLSGCSLAAGLANGIYTVTIPINVSAAASSGNNSASISSQGATCPGNPGCGASTGNIGIAAGPHVIATEAAAVSAINTAALLAPIYTVSVTVSGLASGTNVALRNNGADNLTVNANGTATFSNGVTGAYAVTVFTQPFGATCTVSAGAGVATSNVSNIPVTCIAGRFALVAQGDSARYPVTDCVKDNFTGLIWEGKTTTGLRAAGNVYTNYDNTGQAQMPSGSTYINPTAVDVGAPGNSVGYKNQVNAIGLCGYSNWRIPTHSELGVVIGAIGPPNTGNLVLWFPNTPTGTYWSATAYGPDALLTTFINFGVGQSNRGYLRHVRLVR